MNRRLVVFGGAFLAATFMVVTHIGEKVNTLRTVNVNVPLSGSGQLSVQQFYPVFAQNISQDEASSNGSFEDAFFTPEPEPEPLLEIVTLDIDEDIDEVASDEPEISEPEPEPEPISPIDFLSDRKGHFNLQATMPEQKAAIINGTAFRTGDSLPRLMNVEFIDRYGTTQHESIEVFVGQVSRGYVILSGVSERGWPQSLTLRM